MFNFFKKKTRYRIVYKHDPILQDHWKVEKYERFIGWVFDCKFGTQSGAEQYVKNALEKNGVVRVYEAE